MKEQRNKKSRQSSGDFGTVLGKRGKSSCSRQSRVRDDGHLRLQRAQLLEQSGYPVRYFPCHVGFMATGTHLSGHVLDDSYRVFHNKGDSCLLLSSCSKLNPHFCACFPSEKCEVVFEQVLGSNRPTHSGQRPSLLSRSPVIFPFLPAGPIYGDHENPISLQVNSDDHM
jgi:hypothetical protein